MVVPGDGGCALMVVPGSGGRALMVPLLLNSKAAIPALSTAAKPNSAPITVRRDGRQDRACVDEVCGRVCALYTGAAEGTCMGGMVAAPCKSLELVDASEPPGWSERTVGGSLLASSRACANSCTVAKQSCGSFASALSTTFSTAGEMVGLIARSGGAGENINWVITSPYEPSNGQRPHSHS